MAVQTDLLHEILKSAVAKQGDMQAAAVQIDGRVARLEERNAELFAMVSELRAQVQAHRETFLRLEPHIDTVKDAKNSVLAMVGKGLLIFALAGSLVLAGGAAGPRLVALLAPQAPTVVQGQ